MEIRCGKCNKLFRVSDDKISGKGIKFSCTQCGETVKITREDFDTYTLSKTAVSALDMFEPKPKPAAPSTAEPATVKEAEPVPDLSAEAFHAPLPEPKDSDQPSPSIPDFLQEREEPAITESNPFEELSVGEAPQPEPEPRQEEKPATASPVEPGPIEEAGAPRESEVEKPAEHNPEPVSEPKPEPAIPKAPEQKQEQERVPEPALDLVPVPKPEPKQTPKTVEAAAMPGKSEPKPVVPKAAPARAAVPPATPKKEPAPPATKSTTFEIPQTEPSHPGKMILVVLSVVILVGAIGYGVYKFMLPSLQKAEQPASEMTSIEGLRIINPSGSVEPNGDLLITGTVENTTDKERSGWYVVVDVYDAKGSVLNKIRLLNGKQIYSRADYDVLSKRGVNVPELKAKILQNQGVVIPAKGSITFEMRYIQPPVGIASFNALLQPFDPMRLFKEIEQETK